LPESYFQLSSPKGLVMSNVSTKVLGVLLLAFIAQCTYAQDATPVFKTKSDSVKYYTAQDAMRNHNPLSNKRVRMDSLWEVQQSVLKNGIIGWRYSYRADKSFTSFESLLNKEIEPTAVTKLSITDFEGKKLPEELFTCTNLEELELINSSVQKLPRQLNKLTKLHSVEIYNNQPSKPLRLSKNSTVTFLKIRSNKAGAVPSNFRKFQGLDSLDLCRNFLTKFPEIHQNKNLRQLVLSENNLTLENDRITPSKSLQTLYIRRNKITTVPDAIGNFTALKKLSFNYNEITDIKDGIAKLHNLEELSLYQNKLAVIPKGLYELSNLKVIDLYYNQIERIDDPIANLKKLEILYLANNRIYFLSDNIGALSSLRELYLHHNRVSYFPTSLSKLTNLRVLRFNDNSFAAFPDPILSLSNLENIDMSRNRLQSIPPDFGSYQKLQLLIMTENPWEDKDTITALARKMRSNGTLVHLNSMGSEIEEVTPKD
jgi:Leucine-rich repeat (LRR) protein